MRALYCAGEQARVVLDILRRQGGVEDVIILDDDPSLHGERIAGAEIVGGAATLSDLDPNHTMLVSFGAKRGVRLELATLIRERGFRFFDAIDPDATVSQSATLGTGVTVNAQTYIGPGVILGDHVLVDSAVNVSHDTELADGATIAPNATLAGGTTVGRDAFVGAGATVHDHIEIGEHAMVGAGAVVVDDVPPERTVVGVPARPIE